SAYITWADNSTSESGFVIDYATNSTFSGVITVTEPGNATKAILTGLKSDTTYYVRIHAQNAVTSSTSTGAVAPVTTTDYQYVLSNDPSSTTNSQMKFAYTHDALLNGTTVSQSYVQTL